MEFYSSERVFGPSGNFIKNGILVFEGESVIDLLDPAIGGEGFPDDSEVRKFRGILSPGLINAHCHLELSGLKGRVKRGTGLPCFIRDLQAIRKQDETLMLEAAFVEDQKMFASGIQAVGDICNSSLTLPVKRESKLIYHNFIELFSFRPEQSESTFERGKVLLSEFSGLTNAKGVKLVSSLTPHAPYSTSEALMRLISSHLSGSSPVSIHMMESKEELEFLMEGKGEFKSMMDGFGIEVMDLLPLDKNPMEVFTEVYGKDRNLISVHNTYLELLSDTVLKHQQSENVFYCLCPRANQYIEQVDPPLDFLRGLKRKIVLGTDSLASNEDLNLIKELKQLMQYETIGSEEWLAWLTINGAKALGLGDSIGSFEKGKTPGLICIDSDFSVERVI